jgi:hypothetical protein
MVVAIAALTASTAQAATATPSLGGSTPTVSPAPAPGTQGIIMSDGRICNPRWGC